MDSLAAAPVMSGLPIFEASITALDAYRGFRRAPIRFMVTTSSLVDLARSFADLRYPGLPYADAVLETPEEDAEAGPVCTYFRCVDSPSVAEAALFAPLDLMRDPRRNVFLDPRGVYPLLREASAAMRPGPPEDQLFQAAVLLARQPYELGTESLSETPRDLAVAWQRDLLGLVMTGPSPWRALELLLRSGFVGAYWPELAGLSGLDQSKEHHPEGDAWAHTMETFRYRKTPSLRLSLALLLHDVGKPDSSAVEGRRFDRHAEIGSSIAARFLTRLGFPPQLVSDVRFLVRYHMMPAALPRIPLNRLEGIIDDPRFPLLLELYKCDELSTFRGPDGYYEACAAYRSWSRNSRNPWRSPDGKKLARAWLEETPRSPAPSRRGAAR
ncbi:MAG TPA: HD domain-containing protein [Rectinemataceae bacterium]|nr:HD domain-containing protein [Rectinemataceae bacterium]